MRRFIVSWFVCLAVVAFTGGSLCAQHYHAVPHTTTHYDTMQHGDHFHSVPHTTTHFDHVPHYGPDYVPHTSTHYHANWHNGHIDYLPHTTTHLHPTYPGSGYLGSGYASPGYLGSGTIMNPGGIIASSTPTIITQAPPATLPSSIASSSSPQTYQTLKPNTVPYTGQGVRILMPREINATVNYLVDDKQVGQIRTGEEQLLSGRDKYEIRFSRGASADGRDLGIARYSLTEGTYRFAVTEKGWDLFRERDTEQAPVLAPALNQLPKANTLPAVPAPTGN